MQVPVTADALLKESDPDNNQGSGSFMYVGREHIDGRLLRVVLRVPITSVPVNATLVRLNIVVCSPCSATDIPLIIGLLDPKRPFVEGDGTYGQGVTWNQYDTGLPWNTPGGDFVDWWEGPQLPSAEGLHTFDVQDAFNIAKAWGLSDMDIVLTVPDTELRDLSCSFYDREVGVVEDRPYLSFSVPRG